MEHEWWESNKDVRKKKRVIEVEKIKNKIKNQNKEKIK